MINLEKSSIQSDENNQEGATTLSSTSDSLQMKKIKGEFPRVRAHYRANIHFLLSQPSPMGVEFP